MTKITNPGGGGAGDGSGLAPESGLLYMLHENFEASGTQAGYGIFTHASGLQLSDHGSLDGLADDDHTQYMLVDGSRPFAGTASGTADFGVATQLWISGIPVGDNLGGGGGGNPVDSRAATGNIDADTSGAYELGSLSAPWASGHMDELVLNDGAGSLWRLTVDSSGILTTTQVT